MSPFGGAKVEPLDYIASNWWGIREEEERCSIPEYMAHVFPGLFVSAHICKVTTVVTSNAPNTDSMDWLKIGPIRNCHQGFMFFTCELRVTPVSASISLRAPSSNSRMSSLPPPQTPGRSTSSSCSRLLRSTIHLFTALLLLSGVRSSSPSSHQPRLFTITLWFIWLITRLLNYSNLHGFESIMAVLLSVCCWKASSFQFFFFFFLDVI